MNDIRTGTKYSWMIELISNITVVAILAIPFMLLWNSILVPLFHAPVLKTYWVALGLFLFTRIIGGAFRKVSE